MTDEAIRAPLLRSLLNKFGHTDAEELHDNIFNGFMLIENFGGSGVAIDTRCRCPPALPRILYSLTVTFTTNSQNPWDGQLWRRDFEPKIQAHSDPALRDRDERDMGQIGTIRSSNEPERPDNRLPGQGQRARGAAAPRTWRLRVLRTFRAPARSDRIGPDQTLVEDRARSGHDVDSPVHYNVDHCVESADAPVFEGFPEPVS